MKQCYKIIGMLVILCFSFSGNKVLLAVPFSGEEFCPDTSIAGYDIQQQVADDIKYIKQFSGRTSGQTAMISGSLKEYDALLASVNTSNKKEEVKVYVILVNGLSLVDYQAVPDEANDVSKVLDWSKNRKSIQTSFKSYVEQEGKKIAEQLAAQQAAVVNGPAVFCSLVEFEIKYGQDKNQAYQGKKITLYHSTAYGFSDTANYLKKLDALVSEASWSANQESNLSQLVKCMRIRAQEYTKDKLDQKELDDLMAKLAASNNKMEISQYLDQLEDKNKIHAFDHPLRAHVVRVLLSPDASTGFVGTGGAPVYNKVPNAEKNAILVLERIDDAKIDSWFTYINTSNGAVQTTLQYITTAVSKHFFGEDGYTAFTKLINKQLTYYQDFKAKERQLLTDESKADRIIIWDKSYFLSLVKTAPLNTNTYEVELQSDGKLRLTKSVVKSLSCVPLTTTYAQGATTTTVGEYCTPNWEKQQDILLEPFDLIGFVNRSDLSLLTGQESMTNEIVIVPAIHLLYAKDREWNNNVDKGFSFAKDILTIAFPISKLTYGPKLARKIIYGIELSDKIEATASISVTLGIGGKDYQEIVDTYGTIQTYLSHSATVYQVAQSIRIKDLANYVASVMQREPELKSLASQSEEIRYVLALKDRIDREAKSLKGDDWVKQYASILSPAGLAAKAGKVVNGGKNLLEIESAASKFRALGNKQNPMRAGDFWRNTSQDVNHYISKDGKYYIKHNTKTQQVLFIELDDEPKFLGYGLDEEKLIGGDYEKLIKNLKTIHALPSGSSSISIHGETIRLSTEKANVILGKYNPNNVPGISGETGTDDIIEELSTLKNYAFADEGFVFKPGSVCILNIPTGMNTGNFFDDYNVTYLDKAIKNKQDVEIIFVSDPRKVDLLEEYAEDKDKAYGVFTRKPSGLGKEVKYLRDRGISKVKLKDGTSIDLNSIDLNGLDWSGWKY